MTGDPRTHRTKSGRLLTDADIEALANEAERGYDVKRSGRPRIGRAPAVVVPIRLHDDLHTALKALAEAERTSLSELVRDALRDYLATPAASSGRTLTNADLDALAEQAEAGYDVSTFRARPKRRIGRRAEVVPVRMPPELKSDVERRAEAESTSVSEIVRAALRARLAGNDDTVPSGGGGRGRTRPHAATRPSKEG